MKKTRIIAIIMSIVMAGMTWAPVSTFASAADDSVAVTEDNIEVEDIEEIDDMYNEYSNDRYDMGASKYFCQCGR